jgi:hypothetical protein
MEEGSALDSLLMIPGLHRVTVEPAHWLIEMPLLTSNCQFMVLLLMRL